jgi:hypothetical protein
LGLTQQDCVEASWIISSAVYLAGYSTATPEILLQRNRTFSTCFKAKSDCAKEAIPETALEGLWQRLLAEDNAVVVFTPYSGMMSRISDSFPS